MPALVFVSMCFGAQAMAQQARQLPVHYVQGASHAFLVIRTEAGAVLGYGELLQLVRGERVTSRLTYHFRDGSVDDESTIYTQRGSFHFVSDHHLQHGPFFSKATDFLLEENGDVTIRTVKSDGKETVETSHIELPPDVSNGYTGALLLNSPPGTAPFKLSLVAASGKGRLIRLAVSLEAGELCSPVRGVLRKATVYRIHPELGGIAGVVAPVVGRQPK